MKRLLNLKVAVLGLSLSFSACTMPFSKSNDSGSSSAPSAPVTFPFAAPPRYLYVASGTCYAGGVTTSNPANAIYKYNLDTGQRVETLVDYNSVSPGDSPVSLANFNDQTVLATVENANARRIDEVNKSGLGVSPFLFNSAAFTATLRNLAITADGSYLVTKAAAVEKFTNFRTRFLNGTNPYINNPTATACTGMNTALTFTLELSNGAVVVGSAAATPNNKIASFNPTGYSATTDCLSSKSGPTTTALPTAAVNVAADTFLVAYSSAASGDNVILSYQYSPSTTNLSAATVTTALSNSSLAFGVSAMAFDASTNTLFVANSPQGGERIERFSWNPTTHTLTRIGTTPFIQSGDLTCMSGLAIGN